LSEYLAWLVIIGVAVAWYFYPDLIETFGQIILFWAPAIVLFLGLIIALTYRKIKIKKDEEKGITEYEIILKKSDFYLIDIIIYLGAILILLMPFIFNKNGGDIIDLFQALIFFLLGTWIKKIIYKKIPK